ncbi:TetR/AcrR family transcriptional regulator [Kribbella sp. NPDC048928]|uniref:TetR/AcrR family transcriptional regulator n=1 Tax=Kribbella sp. NPDC048928 TaxID=3364111 RepID=UPI0037170DF9
METCQVCAKVLPVRASGRGRPRRYCSQACRSKAHRQRSAEVPAPQTFGRTSDSGPDSGPDSGSGLATGAIVDAAIALGDRGGADAVSMRAVAVALDSSVMSLYRHVPGREALINLMVDKVFGEQPLPEPGPDGWRAKLELSVRIEWSVYLRHPWVARLVANTTRPPLAPNLFRYTDWRIRALDGLGLPFEVMTQTAIVLSTQLQGAALGLHAEHEAIRRSTRDDWTKARQEAINDVLTTQDLPMIARFGPAEYAASAPDRIVEFGLARLLDGIEAMVS